MESIPESNVTLQLQVDALAAGTNFVVFFPPSAKWIPTLPDNADVVFVTEDVPGKGTYFFNPQFVLEKVITDHARQGTHGELLGFVQDKLEVVKGVPGVMVARDRNGIEIRAACVDVSNVSALLKQKAILAFQFPDASIKVETIQDLLMERLHGASSDARC